MRAFELILIVVNFLSLVLALRRQPGVVWLGMAGLNLAVFLIHGIFEGFRYQMAFSYMFVLLFALHAFLRTTGRFESGTPKARTFLGASLCFVLLGLTAFLAQALPVFKLPKPTGSYEVGIQYLHLIDENRMDPFLDPSTRKRELMVKVYYPAQKDDTKAFSHYFHNSRELMHLLTSGYGLPDFLFDQLLLVRTNAKEGLLLSEQAQSYPVILFSHGAGTTMEVQTSQSEDLASHGYIVLAIDHTYASAGTVFPDRIVSAKEATTDFKTAEPAEIITQIMADDATFVMDTLAEMNEGHVESMFRGRLDLEHIGVIGHSVGGAVAYNLAIHDSRVKAAVNLDGAVFITPNRAPEEVAPFLMLANDKFHVQAIQSRRPLMKTFEDMDEVEQKITSEIHGSKEAYEEAYHKAELHVIELTNVLKSSGTLYSIEGSDHMKFVDIGLFIGVSPVREWIGIAGHIDPARCLEITKAVSVAFFDQHLKGETRDALKSLTQKYPELERVDLK